jgi:DNA-binding MarR family transcriptional regulator
MSKAKSLEKWTHSDLAQPSHELSIGWLVALRPDGPEPRPHELDVAARRVTRLIVQHDSRHLPEVEEQLRALLVAWVLKADADRAGIAGFVRALSLVASAANERQPGLDTVDALDVGSIGERFIETLSHEGELSGSVLAARLDKDLTEVSRTGARLIDLGLVTKTRAGKSKFWRVTPRGNAALRETARRHVESRKPAPELVVPGSPLARYVRQRERSRPHFEAKVQMPAAPVMLRSTLSDDEGQEAIARELRTWATFGDFSPVGSIQFNTLAEPGQSAIWGLLAAAVNTTPRELRTGFGQFWPGAAPHLDAVGTVTGRGSELGLVLLDAPRRPASFSRTTRLAAAARVEQARAAVDETLGALHVGTADLRISDAKYPDWVRRLVLQHYLRETYPLAAVWAAHICFIAEPHTSSGGLPSARRDWEFAYEDALGPHARDALEDVAEIFPVPLELSCG